MNGHQVFSGLQFNPNEAFVNEIGPESLFKGKSSILDHYGFLPFNFQSLISKHLGQHNLINCFQQTQAQISMQAKRTIHNDRYNLFLILSCLCVVRVFHTHHDRL